jgi:hypothetical protein
MLVDCRVAACGGSETGIVHDRNERAAWCLRTAKQARSVLKSAPVCRKTPVGDTTAGMTCVIPRCNPQVTGRIRVETAEGLPSRDGPASGGGRIRSTAAQPRAGACPARPGPCPGGEHDTPRLAPIAAAPVFRAPHQIDQLVGVIEQRFPRAPGRTSHADPGRSAISRDASSAPIQSRRCGQTGGMV